MKKKESVDWSDINVDFLDDGIPVVPGRPPKIRFRNMHEYCKQKNIEPKDLTDQEWELFTFEEEG